MNKDLPKLETSEEIDLGQLFKLIEKAFNRLFSLIKLIFVSIFSIFIYTIKPLIEFYKTIIISMIIAGVLGYGLEKIQKDVYISQMFIKAYFETKFQLIANIEYYNALIEDKNFNKLSGLFYIKEESAKKLIKFEIEPGPETENERILQYEGFISSIDSIRAQDIDFDEYIENRSVYNGNNFVINVKSFKKDIFPSLAEGLNNAFTTTHSIRKMQKRDSLIALNKERILKSLNKMDSLQKIYINVLKETSSSNDGVVTLKDGISLVQERVKTKEYELLVEQLKLRKELVQLESQKVENDVYFDVLSSFRGVGSKYSNIRQKYSLIFPVLIFILLSIIYLSNKFVKFVKTYKE